MDASVLELLLMNDPGPLANDHELVGRNIWNGLGAAVCPANAEVGYGFISQPEMQALVVHRVETGLSAYLPRLYPVAVPCGHSCSDRAAIAAHSNQQDFQPVVLPRKIISQQGRRLVHVPNENVDVAIIVEVPESAPTAGVDI